MGQGAGLELRRESGVIMSRIPTHTLEDAPEASAPVLRKIAQATPGGRSAALHAQMAHSPAVLLAYNALRTSLTEHTAFEPRVGAALTLASAAGVGNDYMIRIATRLALMMGWSETQVTALRGGGSANEPKVDALAALVHEGAANAGKVSDATWNSALQAGWSGKELADAFAYLGATAFTGYFLNFAQTEPDI